MCAESPRPSKGLRVTACRNEDLVKVQAILQSAPEAAAWSPTGLAVTFEHYPSYFLLSRQGEQIAGVISGRRVADEGEILNLAVDPKCRRQGVGRTLVEALLEVFLHEHVREIFLEVRESNASAIAFYESLGFLKVGRRPVYYQSPPEAALLLKRSINSQSEEG